MRCKGCGVESEWEAEDDCGCTHYCPECAERVPCVDLGADLGLDRYQGVPRDEGGRVGTAIGVQVCCGAAFQEDDDGEIIGGITVVSPTLAECTECHAHFHVVTRRAYEVVDPYPWIPEY